MIIIYGLILILIGLSVFGATCFALNTCLSFTFVSSVFFILLMIILTKDLQTLLIAIIAINLVIKYLKHSIQR